MGMDHISTLQGVDVNGAATKERVGLRFKRKTGGVASAAGTRSYAETLKMGLE